MLERPVTAEAARQADLVPSRQLAPRRVRPHQLAAEVCKLLELGLGLVDPRTLLMSALTSLSDASLSALRER